MRLTPIEIRQHRFNVRVRGFDRDEVEAFADFFAGFDATGLTSDDLPGADVDEDDPAAIVFTSAIRSSS